MLLDFFFRLPALGDVHVVTQGGPSIPVLDGGNRLHHPPGFSGLIDYPELVGGGALPFKHLYCLFPYRVPVLGEDKVQGVHA
ncbi:hypothetical protein ES708_12802 [subsurface metagenome]